MKIKKVITLLALLLFAVSQGAFAQKMIFGKVVDANDDSGMPGVNIIVKGTPFLGTTTDIDGNFALRVPNDATIVISFTGYKTIEMPVENETDFDIALEQDVQVLGEVVVTERRNNQLERVTTAMGIERAKETLTTAVHQVSGDEIRSKGFTTVDDGLANIPSVHGLWADGHFVVTSLRSNGGFGGDAPPLYVVDGIPLRRLEGEGGYTDISWLDVELVESVTVLPSINAAVLYGSEGYYGAIVITLKK